MTRLLTILFVCVMLGGCTAEDVSAWKAESQKVADEVTLLQEEFETLKAEYEEMVAEGDNEAAEKILLKLESVADEIETGAETVTSLNENIQSAESGWDIAEAGLVAAAGFIPGIGVMIPIVRTFRRRFTGVVAAVSAGGGPSNPIAASRAMDPKLQAVVRKTRHKLNDYADRSS